MFCAHAESWRGELFRMFLRKSKSDPTETRMRETQKHVAFSPKFLRNFLGF
jgi:hypothetical protein